MKIMLSSRAQLAEAGESKGRRMAKTSKDGLVCGSRDLNIM